MICCLFRNASAKGSLLGRSLFHARCAGVCWHHLLPRVKFPIAEMWPDRIASLLFFRKRFPIGILSFDQPRYLREVLLSLRRQVDRRDQIVLFQDGARNKYSGQLRAMPDNIAASILLFQRIVPWGVVVLSDCNLGVAENYERAEQEFFDRMKAPCALFLEDDLVLSPNFLTVTRMLLNLAQRDSRIGYVSAYGNFWAPPSEQKSRARELIHMHENWGFAMTREAWLAERLFRQECLRLVQGTDYVLRDEGAIIRFYESRGWKTNVTSQDAARWIASLELRKVRLTSFPCHARYIGRVGLHSDEAYYDAAKFSSAAFYPERPSRPKPPTDAQIENWLVVERGRFTSNPRPFYEGHGHVAHDS
jgi:hypothetical protein